MKALTVALAVLAVAVRAAGQVACPVSVDTRGGQITVNTTNFADLRDGDMVPVLYWSSAHPETFGLLLTGAHRHYRYLGCQDVTLEVGTEKVSPAVTFQSERPRPGWVLEQIRLTLTPEQAAKLPEGFAFTLCGTRFEASARFQCEAGEVFRQSGLRLRGP